MIGRHLIANIMQELAQCLFLICFQLLARCPVQSLSPFPSVTIVLTGQPRERDPADLRLRPTRQRLIETSFSLKSYHEVTPNLHLLRCGCGIVAPSPTSDFKTVLDKTVR